MTRSLVQSTLFSIGLHALLLVPLGLKLGATTGVFTDVIRGKSSVELEFVERGSRKEESGEEEVCPVPPPPQRLPLEEAAPLGPPASRQELWENDGGAATRISPSSLRNPAPRYPWQARVMGWQGRVILKARVMPEGKPADLQVSQGSGHPILDEAALVALSRWRFVPARRKGRAVASWVEIPVQFQLGSDREGN